MMNKRVWLPIAFALLLLLGLAGLIGWRLTPYLRDRVVAALADRFDSQVSLTSLRVIWSPRLGVTGEGLVIRHRGRTDVPPLIELQHFAADASLPGLLARPLRLATVRVTGLRINIPPHDDRDDRKGDDQSPAKSDAKPDAKSDSKSDSKSKSGDARGTDLTIEHLITEDATLSILPKEADKDPKVFQIHRVQLDSLGLREQASFEATLTNPIPRGDIHATGTIGPWSRDDPGETLLGGNYTFSHADMSVIHGIGGILDSTGRFTGRLDRIEVDGEARVPDFRIAKAGNPVPLQTKFQAIVDGTSGDTILQRVEATLQNSPMVCNGAIIDVKGAQGHDIKVHVTMGAGRIEDMLRLAVRADQPLMTGVVALQADLEIPPGEQDVIDKLRLNGRFGLEQARFTSATVQEKIEELSKRARGKTDEPADNVASNLRGGFALRDGVLHFSRLEFDVPGAAVHLDGSYALRGEAFDLSGTVTLQAKVSQTVTGYKSMLLKVIDPLFKRKNAGAVIPINVKGTRKDPKIGLDFKRALTGGD
jgi:hypothetical protein